MIGIIGYGFVGQAIASGTSAKTVIYDKYIPDYTEDLALAMQQNLVFICVPTDLKYNTLDTSIVIEVSRQWKELRSSESILIIKSTVPVGTTDRLKEICETDRIVFNPEFLTERTANQDFIDADEVIIGTYSQEIGEEVATFYRSLGNAEIKFVEPKIAELIKLTRNTYYAVKVEFMNEIYDLCKKIGIDYDVFRRNFAWEGNNAWVNPQHTFVPGPDGQRGYGGKCLPKDSEALNSIFLRYGLVAPVLNAVIKTNPSRRKDHKDA